MAGYDHSYKTHTDSPTNFSSYFLNLNTRTRGNPSCNYLHPPPPLSLLQASQPDRQTEFTVFIPNTGCVYLGVHRLMYGGNVVAVVTLETRAQLPPSTEHCDCVDLTISHPSQEIDCVNRNTSLGQRNSISHLAAMTDLLSSQLPGQSARTSSV